MAENEDNGLDSILTAEEVPTEVDNTPNEPIEDDIPEKYRGKSVKDIIEMHQNSEKLIGKHANEVGELRKVVDDFIKTQVSKDSTTTTTQDDDVDFFVDPEKAVSKAVEKHPAIKKAEEAAEQLQKQTTVAKLEKEFPDVWEVVQSSDFLDWVKASKVRTQLLVQADTKYDYDAASELLSTWNSLKGKQNKSDEMREIAEADRKEQLKAAAVPTKGSSEGTKKKVYLRSEIIKLMQNPTEYKKHYNAIRQAYAEGRVK